MNKNKEFIFRDFTDADFDVIAAMMSKEWYGDVEEHQAYLCAASELALHLSNSTYLKVASVGDKIYGVCLARVAGEKGEQRWADIEEQIFRDAHEQNLTDAIACLGIHRGEAMLEESVGAEYGTEGVGCVELLLVSDDSKGMGVGTTMIEECLGWFKSRNLTRYRLATDDSCDWEYYEHRGMIRRGVILVDPLPAFEWDGDYHLYVYEDEI